MKVAVFFYVTTAWRVAFSAQDFKFSIAQQWLVPWMSMSHFSVSARVSGLTSPMRCNNIFRHRCRQRARQGNLTDDYFKLRDILLGGWWCALASWFNLIWSIEAMTCLSWWKTKSFDVSAVLKYGRLHSSHVLRSSLTLQDIVDTHPGLTFLKDAPEFHSRYITTVSNIRGEV